MKCGNLQSDQVLHNPYQGNEVRAAAPGMPCRPVGQALAAALHSAQLPAAAAAALLQGDWGSYRTCRGGRLICGFRQKVEEPRGPVLDDTALNRIQVRMWLCATWLGADSRRWLFRALSRLPGTQCGLRAAPRAAACSLHAATPPAPPSALRLNPRQGLPLAAWPRRGPG